MGLPMDDFSWKIRRFTETAPVTSALIGISILTFLLSFFQGGQWLSWLVSDNLLARPWTVVTHLAVFQSSILSLLVGSYMWFWVGGSLETTWGSNRFAAVLLFWGALSNLSMSLGNYVLYNQGFLAIGYWQALGCLFVMWAMMNPRATVLFMFVIPIEARILGYLSLLLLFFGSPFPLGCFAVAPALLGWAYVANPQHLQFSPAKKVADFRRQQKKKKFRTIDGGRPAHAPRTPSIPESRIDAILDKISRDGMASLTLDERELLDRHSANLRDA